MYNAAETKFLKTLVGNPNAMIVEAVFQDGEVLPVPFVCKRFPGEAYEGDPASLERARILAQAAMGAAQNGSEVNDMESEFP